MRYRIQCVAAALTAMLATGNIAAGEPAGAPVVIELFTSQGCSSCPPAEAILGELAGRSDVLPLAFHVTYWDNLGWRDRFSFSDADRRQYRYASAMGKRSVYTPQMIVNGSRDVLGSNRNAVMQAISAAQPPAAILLSAADGALRIELPDIGGCDCELLLLGVLPSVQTAVGRGENAGRLLSEFNVVRRSIPLKKWNGRAAVRAQPLPLLPDASQLVLLAQRRQDSRIMAAGVAR